MQVEPFSKISFYIIAHADDWQLFMQPHAYTDIVANNTKVIFIVTTAGDAGISETFWRAREEGMKSSVSFCLAPFTNIRCCNETVQINQHPIHCWRANNTTSYFLRLPDGNLDGSGFDRNSHRSLSTFKKEQTSTLTTVDSSTTYNNWSDFCETLEHIIRLESQEINNVHLLYLNPDTRANPDDHSDHIATGWAVQHTNIASHLKQTLFVGYRVFEQKKELDLKDVFWKAGMFAAYEKTVYDIAGYSTLKEDVGIYRKWCLSDAGFITIYP